MNDSAAFPFALALGDSVAAQAILAHDWGGSTLEPMAMWTRHLRATVAMIMRCPTPMALLVGPSGALIYNDGYRIIIGDKHPSALGMPVAEIFPEAADFNRAVLRAALAGESFSYRDMSFVLTRNGVAERAWFDLDYSPVYDDDVIEGVLAVVIEKTALVSASEQLAQRHTELTELAGERELTAAARRGDEVRNRQILDSAVDYAIVAFDLDGRVTRWNEGAHRVLGWTEEEMLGQNGARFFTPEDQRAGTMQSEMCSALQRGMGNDERWHMRKNGERFWASGEMTPLQDEAGQAIGFVKVLRDQTERHQAAQALRESTRLLDHAQAVGGLGTFTVDIASGMLAATKGFYDVYGLTAQGELAAATIEALVLPDDAHKVSHAMNRANRSAPLEVEYRIRRASDGALRWIARKAEFDVGGARGRMVGVVQDITDRKSAELALADSAAQFRTLTQALPNQVWTAGADGALDWVNDRVAEFAGTDSGDRDGNAWTRIVHADELATAQALWRASVATGTPYEAEFRMRRADGQFRWHLVRALPLRGADGAIGRWIGTSTDIHAHKLLEAQSKRDHNRIWTLSQELMLICDMAGVIEAVNPAATRLLGWSEAEMVGKSLPDFVHPDDGAITAAELVKLEQGETTLAFENRYRAKDGGYRLLNWTAVPDGARIHGVARDVTRERATEAALRQSQKLEAIGHLTGGVAHDFNNVLAVIRTSVDLLRMVQLTSERRRRYTDAISDAVTRATKLTAQLLAFARRQALQPVVFNVNQNIEMVSAMIGSLTGARIAMTVQLADVPCFVDADPNQFDTAIVNLAVNARDAMDGKGKLTIRVTSADGIPAVRGHEAVAGHYVAISVADTGMGITHDDLAQIFEPFFTTKGSGQGTGLGLSQVFGFAKQSGGEIVVDSEPGRGACFTLYLPQAASTGQVADAAPADDGVARGAGECVLLVEDNADLAVTVELTLDALGYKTVLVASGEAALAELARGADRFALVFSDVVMGGISGVELGKEVRRLYPALPVVLSSGYSYLLASEPGHGFTLLPKPYALDELARTLSEAINGMRRPIHQAAPHGVHAKTFDGTDTDAHDQELFRLAELDALHVLDTAEEAAYDELTALAASYFNAPIALISLVDDKRQWFKSRVGLQARETPRELAFCAHSIQTPHEVTVVADATQDQRFAANPLVTGDPHIRFYAAAPLVAASGLAIGTLCVIDTEPRVLDAEQAQMLQMLAGQVMSRLEARKAQLQEGASPG